MHHVPERWQSKLDEYVRANTSGQHRDLTAVNFRHNVHLQMPDGSSAFFRHAFYLIDRDLNEIAVFTDHCGYHYFPLFDAHIELLDPVHGDVGT